MRLLLLTLPLLTFGGCLAGCKRESVQLLDETLTTLEEHGVYYEAELSGQTSGEVYQKMSLGMGTPGWFSIRFRSPHMNPLTHDPAVPTSQPSP